MVGAILCTMGRNEQVHEAWRSLKDPEVRLRVALTTTEVEALATVAPSGWDHDASSELVWAVLASEVCTPSIAGRFVGHRDRAIRLELARRPDSLHTTLQILARDLDPEIRTLAQVALDADPLPPSHGI